MLRTSNLYTVQINIRAFGVALHGMEQSKTLAYFGWECGVQTSQSRVQSKIPAYFGLEGGLHSKNLGLPNALINITLSSNFKLTICTLISFGPSWLFFGSWSWFWIIVQVVSDLYYSDKNMQCQYFFPQTQSLSDYITPHNMTVRNVPKWTLIDWKTTA